MSIRNKKKVELVSIEMVNEVACSKNDYELIEQKEEVRYLLNSLEDKHKEVMLLHYMFDLTLNEISEIQKVRNGTVKSRMSRAKEKMREIYKKGVLYDGK